MNTLLKLMMCSMITFSPTSINEDVLNQTEPKETIILSVELNDINAVSNIKKQIIELKYDNLDNIDIEQSEIKIEGLDVSKLGTHDVLINMNIKNKGIVDTLIPNGLFSEKVRIEVKDTTSPELTLRYKHIWLDYKEELIPLEWIEEVKDNDLTENINIVVNTSNLDITNPNDYQIYYTATDKSGNEITESLLVTVKEEIKPYTYYGSNDDKINEMLTLINNARIDKGLTTLSLGSSNAQKAVGVRACEAADYTSHTRPDGRHYKTALDDYNVSYSSPYEILTYSGSSVKDKFNWWMSSKGHKSYILHSSSNKIAIGYCGKMWSAIIYSD